VENIITAVLAAGFSKTSLANLKSAAAAFSSEAGVCHCLIFVLGVLFSNYFEVERSNNSLIPFGRIPYHPFNYL
jgi:hypothetical protein